MGRKPTELTAFIDGASSGNPGHAGAAVVFHDASHEEVDAFSIYLGETTNNVAEYRALVLALERALELGVRRLTVFSDSELLVKQLTGRYRVKNAGLRPHFERAKELEGRFESLKVRYVPRGENQRADQLARQAAFRRISPPQRTPLPPATDRLLREALALHEVSLLPQWSPLLPEEVNTETRLVGRVQLSIPLLSLSIPSKASIPWASAVAQRGGMVILRPGRSSGAQIEAIRGIRAKMGKIQRGGSGQGDGRDDGGKYRIGALVYPSADLLDRLRDLVEVGVDLVILETSLGRGPDLVEGIAKIKGEFPQMPLIAGDVTDVSGAQRAMESGADGLKVGAPFILGMRVPLFTAIQDCAAVAEKHGGTLVADVGTSELMVASGRIARAIGAGAHAALVALKTDEAPGRTENLTEGLDHLVEDLRMIMSCCGVGTVEELRQKAKFVRIRGMEGA